MRKVCLLVVALSACSGPEPLPRGASLTAAADVAAERTGIPADLLLALAIQETSLRPGLGDADAHHGHDTPTLGVLALRPTRSIDQIALAEELTGLTRAELAADPGLGLIAGAEVLAAVAQKNGDAPADLRDWIEVATRASGLPEGTATRRFAGELASMMRHGAEAIGPDGERVVVRAATVREIEDVGVHELAAAEYGSADWSPASGENYTSGRGGNGIDTIVIHTVQGSYNGCISWFANPAAQASAHFVVRSSDGAVTQMVSEGDTAWHAGNWDVNQRSIGIEHEGWVDDPGTWYTESMYAGSAALVRYLADKYGVPIDRDHIFGHNEVPDPNNAGQFGGAGHHTDPGGGWDWDHFMGLVDDLGGGGRPDFGAELTASDHPAEMTSGDRAVAWVELTNAGRQTWGLDTTSLMSVDDPAPLFDQENWLGPLRATGPDHSTYSTGVVGRFTFMIQAPDVAEDTHVVQRFAVEEEGVGRIGPAEDVVFDILVHPAAGADPGDDDPADDDPGPGADPDDPGGDPAADPGDEDFPGYGGGSGGCSVADDGANLRAHGPWSAFLLALGVLLGRRRR